MSILITGAGGFIGSHLMDSLPEAVGFDNFLTGRRENCTRVIDLDIVDRASLYDLANDVKPEVVIHCAASYSDPDLWHRDADINIAGGINAALVAKYHDAHLIYFQTILPPVSSYAISKIASEQYQRLSGVPLTVLRMANAYGPRNLSGPIPVFYKRLVAREPCIVVDTTRDMVFIDDVVECVLRVANKRITGTYDVCSGVQYKIQKLYDLVAHDFATDEVPPVIPPNPDDVQGEISPANRVPSWTPNTGLDMGIRKTLASYRQAGVTDTYTHLRIAR